MANITLGGVKLNHDEVRDQILLNHKIERYMVEEAEAVAGNIPSDLNPHVEVVPGRTSRGAVDVIADHTFKAKRDHTIEKAL